MEKIFLLFAYLLTALITVELSLTIFSYKSDFIKVMIVAILSGCFDYLIKECVVPKFNLFEGLHIITGIVFLAIICKRFFKLNLLGSLCISILSYILSGIGEFLLVVILVPLLGFDYFKGIQGNRFLISFYSVLGMLTLLIPLIYLKKKNTQLIKLNITDNN